MPVAFVEIRKGRISTFKLDYFNEVSVRIKLLFLVNITCVASVRVYMKINVAERGRNSFFWGGGN
jgi:hypothetical protein